MAEEMTGIERLREAAETVYSRTVSKVTGGVIDVGRGRWMSGEELTDIADRIECEHAEELAAAKRDMTDEAREVMERLRAIDVDKCTRPRKCWDKLIDALGTDSYYQKDVETGFQRDMRLTRDRLCDLIEHGGRQDVDVAALRELADDLDDTARRWDSETVYVPRCSYSGAYRDMARIVRKAIEGAPVDLATAAGNLVARCRPCRERREAAADWVEAHGGLDAVVERMAALDDFISDVAEKVGVPIDEKGPMTICGDVIEELDKRLMPCGLTWPRFSDDKPVTRDDAPEDAIAVALALDGSCYWFEYDVPDLSTWESGERVLRAKPAVLGADGIPIEVGQAMYNAGGTEYVVGEILGGKVICQRADDRQWCSVFDADRLTHERPDTQERIDEGKGEEFEGYWGCDGCNCEACPSLIDGEKPCEHYGVVSCAVAQGMDIARREQELEARTTGGAR